MSLAEAVDLSKISEKFLKLIEKQSAVPECAYEETLSAK